MPHARGVKSLEEPWEVARTMALFQPAGEKTLPIRLDYAESFGRVQNQDPFGTCVAFGTGALFEFWMRQKTGNKASISKRAVFSMARHRYDLGSEADDGLCVYQGLSVLEQAYVDERNWPYERESFRKLLDIVPDELLHSDFRITGYERVSTDIGSIRAALAERGPLVIGLEFFDSWDTLPETGVLTMPRANDGHGGHCVVVVGYDDRKEYLHFRNSWSWEWGDRGYCWMPYDFVTMVPHGWPQQIYLPVFD